MWVKICGTTNLEDALLAVDAGADAVGFVFAESTRHVTAEQVAEMTPHLPANVEKIGVFTTQDADEIFAAATHAGLTGVQLHSGFLPSLPMDLKTRSMGRLRIVQVVDFAVAGDQDRANDAEQRFEATVRSLLGSEVVDAVLLDTAVRGTSGGTGVAFDWERASAILSRVWPEKTTQGLIVAGGLRPGNVGQAIARLHPWGVDVVSGVEASKGKKDAGKVRAFINEAREPLK